MTLGARALDYVPRAVQIHVGLGGKRRLFAEVEKSLAPIRKLNGHEAAASEITRRGIDHRQRITHCDRGVDRIAAALKHVDTGLGRKPVGSDHHAMFGGGRRCRGRNRGRNGCRIRRRAGKCHRRGERTDPN